MPDTAVLLLVLFAIPAGIVPLLLQRKSLRRNTVRSRLLRLASEGFSGNRHVVVEPRQWQLSEAQVRQLGTQRGYLEALPPAPGTLAFRYAPDAVARHALPQGDAAATSQQRGWERVAAELAGGGFSWATLSEIGGTVYDAAGPAAHHGATILRSFGNQLDPVLLFGKRPIESVREAVAPFVVSSSRASTTEQMTRLIQEFDGRGRVHVIARHFKVDRLVQLDVAAELGYAYSSRWNALRPTSRWYEGWTIFEPADRQ